MFYSFDYNILLKERIIKCILLYSSFIVILLIWLFHCYTKIEFMRLIVCRVNNVAVAYLWVLGTFF